MRRIGITCRKVGPGNLFISFVHSLGEGTRPTRGHTKSASISAGHRSSSGVPPSDHSLLDPQPRNAHNSLLATADPLRQRYRSPIPYRPTFIHSCIIKCSDTFLHTSDCFYSFGPLTLLG